MEANNSDDSYIVEFEGGYDLENRHFERVNKCGELHCEFETNTTDAKERSASMRKLIISVVLCIIFMAVEVVGGLKANSLSILTDAAHLLTDVAAFAISLFSLWAAGWEATPRQSYGFLRVEILGALVSIQLIWLLTGILVYEAVNRLVHEAGEVNGSLMFIVSAFGLVVNIIMALVLGHDHGHGYGHGYGHGHNHGHGHTEHNHTHNHNHGEENNHAHKHDHMTPLLESSC